jgi:hypothetical protein
MMNIRKLAAVDMVFHGARFILAEFAIGIFFPLLIGILSIRTGWFGSVRSIWETAFGTWLVAIGLNYVPLFIYAALIARAGTVQAEGRPEVANAKRYGFQQAFILVPLMIVIMAIAQEMHPGTRKG